jgi:predicted NBD/HSP70 family sugar kinase
MMVGSAEYVGGLPRWGENGFTMELGHTKTALSSDAPPCYCGGRGCLAAFASMYGMAARAGLLTTLSAETLDTLPATIHHLLDLAEAGDPHASAVIDQAATHLGAGVANHLNTADPGTVLILTANRRLKKMLMARVLVVIERDTLPGLLSKTNIIFETADKDWRWKGTAALALESLYLEDDEPPGADEPFLNTVGEDVFARRTGGAEPREPAGPGRSANSRRRPRPI